MPMLIEFAPMPPHRVVALALERLVLLDLAAPAHLFGHCGEDRYSFLLAGVGGTPVMTSSGFTVDVQAGIEALADADTIVVPGYLGTDRRPDEHALRALRRAAQNGARVMSICTGAFALAHAGLLDGRRATTHWDSAVAFAEQFPAVRLDPNVLYIDEGAVLTSAGVAAGLDLCLHLVRRDHGARVASHIARHTVVAPHRDGDQAQFIEQPIPTLEAGGTSLQATRDWALGRRHGGPPAVTTQGLAAADRLASGGVLALGSEQVVRADDVEALDHRRSVH